MRSSPEPGPLRRPASWAFLAPLLCGLHCLAAPLLVVLAPALAPTATLEWTFFLASGGLALWILARRAARGHRAALWALALTGLYVWAASIAGRFGPVPEAATTMVGTLLVAGALFWNMRLRQRGRCGAPSAESAGRTFIGAMGPRRGSDPSTALCTSAPRRTAVECGGPTPAAPQRHALPDSPDSC